jgi:hypothetical protein
MSKLFVRSGSVIKVRIEPNIRALIASMADQLRELLLIDDGDELTRLYPNAYPDDADREASYRAVVHDQLLMTRLEAIDVLDSTVYGDELTVEQADSWLTTINQIRLVLGTKLDVGEEDKSIDPDDPDASGMVVYHLLSHVLDSLTDVRSSML